MKILYIIALLAVSSVVMADPTPTCIPGQPCNPVSLPEPGTWLLIGVGLLAAIGVSRKK